MHRAACKILAGVLIFLAGPARAADGPIYDVFAKALAPFAAAIFGGADGQPASFVAECAVTGATGRMAPALGTRFRLAIQSPDRLRLDVVTNGNLLTACRNGPGLWATPAAPMRSLAGAAGLDLTKTEPDAVSAPLVPLALNAQMLAFLPIVFDVKDLGTEGDPPRRALEFGLLPEVRDAIKAQPFSAKAWIDPDYRPSRVVVAGDDYSLELSVTKLDFAGQLASTAWEPPAGADALVLPASALNELFEKMLATQQPASTPAPQ
jgi:hypothetical protein